MGQEKRYIEEDEITLKSLILKGQDFVREIFKRWKLILVSIIIFAGLFLFNAITAPLTYHGELTFMVNEDDGGGLGGMSAILGQFGLGGGGRGKNNLDKILELSKSRYILQQVIFDSIELNGQNDFVGNHIIRIYDYHEKWSDDTTGLKNFLFVNNELSTRVEKKVLKTIYHKIIGKGKIEGIFITGYDEKTGIMRFNSRSPNEKLSIDLCKILYNYLSDFYVTRTVEKQQQTFDVMLQKVNSVKTEMTAKEYQLAKFLDENRGLYTARAKQRELELKRDVQLLNEMYAVTLKNFEIADFSLKNKTPFIQLIDEPMSPLPVQAESIPRNVIIGSFIGFVLAVLFVCVRKIYNDTMSVNP